MSWYAISTFPGQEQRLCDALKAESPDDTPDCFRFFILPVHKVWMHDNGSKDKYRIAIIFVETEDIKNLQNIRDKIRLGYKLHMTIMYDVVLNQPLVIPERQMKLFQRQNPDFIEEIVVLTHPFAGYAKKNVRFFVMDGPFEGQEGYKINLHREKKLAISFGNMSLALNTLYQYKIVRVIEPSKEPMFYNQQLQRIVSNIIGSLQVHGFADDAYPTLSLLLQLCHEAGDSIEAMESALPDESTHLRNYLRSLDAFTAGHIQSLAATIHQPLVNTDAIDDAMQPRQMLPFLTPTSGSMNANDTHDIIVEHNDFREIIHRVTIQERVPDNSIERSKNKKTPYFAHFMMQHTPLKDETAALTVITADFSAFFHHFESLSALLKAQELIRLEKADSPLYPLLANSEALSITLDTASPSPTMISDAVRDLSKTAVAIIEHLLHTPRLTQWRNLLSEVMIHH